MASGASALQIAGEKVRGHKQALTAMAFVTLKEGYQFSLRRQALKSQGPEELALSYQLLLCLRNEYDIVPWPACHRVDPGHLFLLLSSATKSKTFSPCSYSSFSPGSYSSALILRTEVTRPKGSAPRQGGDVCSRWSIFCQQWGTGYCAPPPQQSPQCIHSHHYGGISTQ